MKHETVDLHPNGLTLGAAGTWMQGTNVFAPYVGGYILEVGFSWEIVGAVASIPTRIAIAYGPNGGPGILLMRYILDTYYNGAAAALVNYLGGTAKTRANFRAMIPGGIPIGAAQHYWFAMAETPPATTAAPFILPEFVVWVP